MKKSAIALLVVTLITSMFSIPPQAEAARKPVTAVKSLSLTPILGEYFFNSSEQLQNAPLYGLKLSYDIIGSSLFDSLGIEATYNQLSIKSKNDSGSTTGNLFRLDATYPFTPRSKVIPFLALGMGGINISSKSHTTTNALLNYGAGVKYFLEEYLALRLDARHLIVYDNINTRNNFEVSLGLSYYFGKERKIKPEPLPPILKCNNVPKGVKVDKFGCPLDSDKDGVADYLDKCAYTLVGVTVTPDGCPLNSMEDKTKTAAVPTGSLPAESAATTGLAATAGESLMPAAAAAQSPLVTDQVPAATATGLAAKSSPRTSETPATVPPATAIAATTALTGAAASPVGTLPAEVAATAGLVATAEKILQIAAAAALSPLMPAIPLLNAVEALAKATKLPATVPSAPATATAQAAPATSVPPAGLAGSQPTEGAATTGLAATADKSLLPAATAAQRPATPAPAAKVSGITTKYSPRTTKPPATIAAAPDTATAKAAALATSVPTAVLAGTADKGLPPAAAAVAPAPAIPALPATATVTGLAAQPSSQASELPLTARPAPVTATAQAAPATIKAAPAPSVPAAVPAKSLPTEGVATTGLAATADKTLPPAAAAVAPAPAIPAPTQTAKAPAFAAQPSPQASERPARVSPAPAAATAQAAPATSLPALKTVQPEAEQAVQPSGQASAAVSPQSPPGEPTEQIGQPAKKKNILRLNVEFAFDKSVVKRKYFKKLREFARLMQSNPETKTVIEGHTDSIGGKIYNLNLSQRRAAAVKNSLIKFGANPDRISVAGYGYSRPIDTNATREGRQRNRRCISTVNFTIEVQVPQ